MAYVYGASGSPVLSGYWPWAAAAASPSGLLLLYGFDDTVGVYSTALARLYSGAGTYPEGSRAAAAESSVWLAGNISPSLDIIITGYDGSGVVGTFTVSPPGGTYEWAGSIAMSPDGTVAYLPWLDDTGAAQIIGYDTTTHAGTLLASASGISRITLAGSANTTSDTSVFIGWITGSSTYTLTIDRYSSAGTLLNTSDPIDSADVSRWNLAVIDDTGIMAINGVGTVVVLPLNLSSASSSTQDAVAEDMACVVPVTFDGPWDDDDDTPATPTPGEDYPMKWLRQAPQGIDELRMTFYGRFELLVDVATGDDLNPNPTVFMKYSNNGGKTWSTARSRQLGSTADVNQRVFWQPCGAGRDRVWRLYGASAAPLGLVDAYVQILGGTS